MLLTESVKRRLDHFRIDTGSRSLSVAVGRALERVGFDDYLLEVLCLDAALREKVVARIKSDYPDERQVRLLAALDHFYPARDLS
ncbi:hypothetical protein JXA12_04690 [Candidatus Woesearchaeota archaeon]|nr:hypothetical protein [Candidatus Woesearchaeota archaeon]